MKRIYKGSDIDMLTACSVIAEHALENLVALEGTNSFWNEAHFAEIKERVRKLLSDIFGIKSVQALQEATGRLVALQSVLLKHLTMLRKQIMTGWQKDTAVLKEILDSLGYSEYWEKAKTNKSQTALVAMLEVFEKGCTPDLLEKFAAKKVSDVSVGFVRSNLRSLFDLNVMQEGKKSSRKHITNDTIDLFNAVYSDTIQYAGSAQTLFSNDPVRRGQFSYSQVLRHLGGGGGNTGKPGDEDDTPEHPE